MKNLKLYESFQLFNPVAQPDANDYAKQVRDHCYSIAMEEMGLAEGEGLERLELVLEQNLAERQQEFDTIISNCRTRQMRPQYCAEVMYHTIHQGRLNALAERDWLNGGFKR